MPRPVDGPEFGHGSGGGRCPPIVGRLDHLSTGAVHGLGYSGGPVIERLAADGDPGRFPFSIPKISDGSLDFSFWACACDAERAKRMQRRS